MEKARLEDRLAIHELTLRYARAIDRRQYDQLNELFVPEARISGPGFSYPDLAAFLQGVSQIERYQSTMHALHNQLIEFDDIDEAKVESYCVASHIYEQDGVLRKLDWGICYRDRCRCLQGRWWLTERQFELLWQQDLPAQLPRP